MSLTTMAHLERGGIPVEIHQGCRRIYVLSGF